LTRVEITVYLRLTQLYNKIISLAEIVLSMIPVYFQYH